MDMNMIDTLTLEIRQCREQLKQDWSNFDNASPEYIDCAIANLKATEQRYKALCRELKDNVFPQKIEDKKVDKIYNKILTFIKK